VPVTVALHCDVAPAATVEGTQEDEIDEIADDIDDDWLLPPQAVRATKSRERTRACKDGCFIRQMRSDKELPTELSIEISYAARRPPLDH
jgi:hypothetical protein